jgi:hypothetical protein
MQQKCVNLNACYNHAKQLTASQCSNIAENYCAFSIILNFHIYGSRGEDILETGKVLKSWTWPQEVQTSMILTLSFFLSFFTSYLFI